MSFFLSPFIFVFQLIAFLIQAAVLYGLALIAVFGLIASVTIIWYGIAELKSRETIVEYVSVVEKHEVTKFVEKGPELVCMKLSGCKIVHDAKTEEEYCPTCVWNSHKRNKDTTSKIDGGDFPPPESKTW